MNIFKLSAACAAYAALLALAGCSKNGDGSGEQPAARQTPVQAETAQRVSQSANEPHVWRIGETGPNGGIVYYAEGGEFYEVLPPAGVIGDWDTLPAGWVTPDMEDLALIRERIQRAGIADYGAWYYVSVTKSGGQNRYLRMSDGQTGAGEQGLKTGVRKFDPSQPPASPLAAFALTQDAIPGTVLPLKQLGDTPPPQAASAKTDGRYAIGEAGPHGGIIFAYSGGKYKEITKPENAGAYCANPQLARQLAAELEALEKAAEDAAKNDSEVLRLQAELNRVDREAQAAWDAWEAVPNDAEHNEEKVQLMGDYLKKVNTEKPQIQRQINDARNAAQLAAAKRLGISGKQAEIAALRVGALAWAAADGWRAATMPELIVVFDALKKTGKVDFGNAVYASSSSLNYRGEGIKYTRSAVAIAPDNAGGGAPALFSGYRIILAGGGPDSSHFMDMVDGAIFLVADDPPPDWYYVRAPLGYKNRVWMDIRIPFVKEF
jgi:hypothetical protein